MIWLLIVLAKIIICNETKKYYPPHSVREVKASVGAGDALLAYASLCLASSKSIVSSNILGSIAAACECEMEGNIAVKKSMIIDKINDLEKSSKFNI